MFVIVPSVCSNEFFEKGRYTCRVYRRYYSVAHTSDVVQFVAGDNASSCVNEDDDERDVVAYGTTASIH